LAGEQKQNIARHPSQHPENVHFSHFPDQGRTTPVRDGGRLKSFPQFPVMKDPVIIDKSLIVRSYSARMSGFGGSNTRIFPVIRWKTGNIQPRPVRGDCVVSQV
jgi:hypothetical protein